MIRLFVSIIPSEAGLRERAVKTLFLVFLLLLLSGAADLMAQTSGQAASGPERKLIVGVTNDPPYIIKEKNGEWTGLNVEIWKNISRDLKLDYEFKELSFKELIDALKEGTIDISIEAIFLLAERQKLIDYSVAVGSTRLGLATLPDKISHPWWTAVKIFLSWGTLKTVGLLCLALCFLGFLFWLIERKSNPDHFGGGVLSGIAAGIYWVGATLASGVCFGVALKSLPARLLGLAWMLVCAIALSTLITSLTNALSESRTVTEVVREETLGRMRLAGIKGSAESFVLSNIGGKYALYGSQTEALRAMLARDVDAFLYDEITLHYLQNNDYRDRISVYPTTSRRFMFAFGLPRNSPLLRDVNYALLKLMEDQGWPFLLKRYGLEANFEQNRVTEIERRIRDSSSRM